MSGGVKNASIHNALVDLLGKPIAGSSALCNPTPAYGHPKVGPGERPWRSINGRYDNPMCELGSRLVAAWPRGRTERLRVEQRRVRPSRETSVDRPRLR
jgi:dipeptidase E